MLNRKAARTKGYIHAYMDTCIYPQKSKILRSFPIKDNVHCPFSRARLCIKSILKRQNLFIIWAQYGSFWSNPEPMQSHFLVIQGLLACSTYLLIEANTRHKDGVAFQARRSETKDTQNPKILPHSLSKSFYSEL